METLHAILYVACGDSVFKICGFFLAKLMYERQNAVGHTLQLFAAVAAAFTVITETDKRN